jgi:hypothetical protein
VVLGSGGERIFPSLAGECGADPLIGGDQKRGLFRNWTVVLAITAFSLSLLGTFLVRSGVLTSVLRHRPSAWRFHSGVPDRCRRRLLTLFAMRASKVRAGGSFKLVSRETFLLLNNVLMTTAAAVLLGTLYPLIVDALNLGKLSVGPPTSTPSLCQSWCLSCCSWWWAPLPAGKVTASPSCAKSWAPPP